jgi:hypothetical protein
MEMKSNKNGVMNREVKPASPVKMKSALTNLDRLVQVEPKTEEAPLNVKPEKKSKAAKSIPAQSVAKPKPTITSVEAKIDVGFGNALFIRGAGAGLSWEKGSPLDCRDQSSWLWSADAVKEQLEFKLLLNDQIWAAGENMTVAPGQKIEVVPSF